MSNSPNSILPGRLKDFPAHMRCCFGFFTRLPVAPAQSGIELAHAAAAWPVVGLLIAILPAALLLVLGQLGANAILSSALALALLAGLTGGLHEDGLADIADGLIGGSTRAAKLDIMRDSRLGTYGALALIFSVIIKVGALAALTSEGAVYGGLALLLSAPLSRALALWHWHSLLPARQDGLSHASGRPDHHAFLIAAASGLVATIILALGFGFSGLFAIVLAVLTTILFARICNRQIGGQTGDTIGAAQQIADLALLAGLALFFTA